jgi:hypothetical protein
MTLWSPLAKEIEFITLPGDLVSVFLSENLGTQLSNCADGLLGGNG